MEDATENGAQRARLQPRGGERPPAVGATHMNRVAMREPSRG